MRLPAWTAIALVALAWFGVQAPAFAQATSAALISDFRVKNGEGRVVADSKLTSIAQDQATAMATKDKLDHDVLGPFATRVASSGSDRAAENIAYGHDNFPKTLDQWINSASHRKNLLLKDASRIGVASAKTASGRTYWAMVIAGYDSDKPKPAAKTAKTASPKVASSAAKAKPKTKRAPPPKPIKPECRVRLLGLCL